MFCKTYDQLKICVPGARAEQAISFLHNFDGALAFLRGCPPFAELHRDMAVALSHDVIGSSRYSGKDLMYAVARRLADGRLVITDRFANHGQFHNFKRTPKSGIQSIPAPAPEIRVPSPPPAAKKTPEIDETAMLQTLKQAAEMGMPFCEVCQKATA